MALSTRPNGNISITNIVQTVYESLYWPEYVCEESISPLSSVRIQHSVQRFLADGFGINDMCDSLHSLKVLQGSQQDPPGCALTGPTGSDHHQTMVQVADLVQLQYLDKQNTVSTVFIEEPQITYKTTTKLSHTPQAKHERFSILQFDTK